MAGEEDVELRDLVAHTLETRGVLGKIRAQLRANVFLALEEQESQQKPHPLVSSKLQQYLKTKEGQVATALVREFLSFFELDYTCSVFDPETNALDTCPGRNQLAKDLGLDVSFTAGPLLDSILKRASSTTAASYQPPNIQTSFTSAPRNLLTTTNQISCGESIPSTSTATAAAVHSDPPLDSKSRENRNTLSTRSEDENVVFKRAASLQTTTTTTTTTVSNTTNIKLTVGSDHVSGTGAHRSLFGTGKGREFEKSAPSSSLNGGDAGLDDLDDFFEKKLPSHIDDGHLRKVEATLSDSKNSYQDDFHSDTSFSENSAANQFVKSGSKLDETEDYTLSQTSLGADFDYVEPAKT